MLLRSAGLWLLLTAATALAVGEVNVRIEAPEQPVPRGATIEVRVVFDLALGWHIYGPKLENKETTVELVATPGFTAGPPVFPEPEEHEGEPVYEGHAEVRIPVTVDSSTPAGTHALTLKVSYLACTEGRCLPRKPREFSAVVRVGEGGGQVGPQPPPVTPPDSQHTAPTPPAAPKGKFEEALEKGLLSMLLLAFGLGLAGTLTPCVYPVIPVTISFFGSGGAGEQSLGRRIVRGFAYFSGIALFYAALGLIAALLSANVAQWLANPWVVGVLCLIFLALALSMFGLYEMNLPPWLLDRVGGRRQGVLGAFFLGAVMSLIAAPCVGPFVGSIFTYASTSGSRLVSFFGLLAFGVGLGFPFLFLSIFAGALQGLPRAGEWMNKLKLFFGFLMLGMIVYFLRAYLPGRALYIVGGILAVFCGTYVGAFSSLSPESGPGSKFGKAFGTLVVVAGVLAFARGFLGEGFFGPPPPKIRWTRGFDAARERAKAEHKPIIVDFTAAT